MTREEEITDAAMHYAYDIDKVFATASFVAGAEWADQHPHWISVEDELPPLTHKEEVFGFDYSDKVLVLLKETDADGMMITFAECNRDHPRVIDGDEPKEECYWSAVKSCDMYEGFGDNITHWMPMPQPPHHIIDANKKIDRVIGTADHIKIALDVLNKKGGEG